MYRADNVMLERLFNSWRTRPRTYASTTLLRGDATTHYHYYRYRDNLYMSRSSAPEPGSVPVHNAGVGEKVRPAARAAWLRVCKCMVEENMIVVAVSAPFRLRQY